MTSEEKRILVVEDEDAIRALLVAVFRRRGLHVDTARNGVEALEHCARCRYSVIVLDMMMPLMSGYEVLEELGRSAGHRPVVIVLSAGGTLRNLNSDLVAATLRKPFDIELLADTVAACIHAAEPVAQPSDCPSPQRDRDADVVPRRRGAS